MVDAEDSEDEFVELVDDRRLLSGEKDFSQSVLSRTVLLPVIYTCITVCQET